MRFYSPHNPGTFVRESQKGLRGRHEAFEMKILLVDDDPMSRKLMGYYLKPLELDLEVVGSGLECLTSVQESAPDLILLDCQMPEMDGFETCRRLRSGGFEGPVWALTGDLDEDTVRRCLEAGMDEHLGKPVNPVALRDKIAQNRPAPSQRAEVDNDPLASVQALAQAAGDSQLAVKLSHSFLKVTDGLLGEMTTAAENDDWSTVRALGHRLQGSAGTFGAKALSEGARQLCLRLRVEDARAWEEIEDLKELWSPLRLRLELMGADS